MASKAAVVADGDLAATEQSVVDVSKAPAAEASSETSKKKVDPYDGQAYTFEELKVYYKKQYSDDEIASYWENECKPMKVPGLLTIDVTTPAGTQVDEFEVEPSSTVGGLIADLSSLKNVDVWHLQLLHENVVLEESSQWNDTSVKDKAALTLVVVGKEELHDATIKKAVEEYCKGGDAKYNCERLYGTISRWDTSNVTSMNSLFQGQTAFNEDLSFWSVGNVTDMRSMFYNATSFNNDLTWWNVSRVTDMNGMFWSASSFNGDLSRWDVSNVTDMSSMFLSANSFNGDLSHWNLSSADNAASMFRGAASFNSAISTWNVSNITTMFCMFDGAESFNDDLSAWSVSEGTNMDYTFPTAFDKSKKPQRK